MSVPDIHHASLKQSVAHTAAKIEGFTATLDNVSRDIKSIEKWLQDRQVRIEAEVIYYSSQLQTDRPDDLEVRSVEVTQTSRAVAWAETPDARAWRLQFREYLAEGAVSLEHGHFLNPPRLVHARPLIETPASVRLQAVEGLAKLLAKVADTIPGRTPKNVAPNLLRSLQVLPNRPVPHTRESQTILPMREAETIPFEEFWARVKKALAEVPGPEQGVNVLTVRKWSQHSGDMVGEFTIIYRGGDTFACDTASTQGWRQISSAEVRKVYDVWRDYRTGRKGRAFIAHDLGVQNTTWIIPLLRRFEDLMF
jgi:hypothetical protein